MIAKILACCVFKNPTLANFADGFVDYSRYRPPPLYKCSCLAGTAIAWIGLGNTKSDDDFARLLSL